MSFVHLTHTHDGRVLLRQGETRCRQLGLEVEASATRATAADMHRRRLEEMLEKTCIERDLLQVLPFVAGYLPLALVLASHFDLWPFIVGATSTCAF